LLRLGRLGDAERSARQALEAVHGLPPGHPTVLARLKELGTFLHMHGQRQEGRKRLAEAVAGMELAFRPGSIAIDNARVSALHAALMDGAAEDVQRALPSLVPLVADASRPPTLRFEMGWIAVRWYLRTRDAPAAEGVLATLQPLAAQTGQWETARLNVARARAALLRGALSEARAWAGRADELAGGSVAEALMTPARLPPLHASLRHERLLIESEIAQRERRFDNAIELAVRSAPRGDSVGIEPYSEEDAAASARRLGESWLAAGDPVAASEPLAAALAIYVREHVASSPLLAETRAAVARCQAALAEKRRHDSASRPGTRAPGVARPGA